MYLETMNPANVRYYTRFGFEIIDTLAEPGTPLTHLMLRPPA